MKTVLLTGAIHPDAEALLEQHARVVVAPDYSFETLAQGMEHADAVIVRHPLPAGAFQAATKLRGVVRHGAGVDMIPVDEANALGILVANVPGVNAEYVAEYAVGQMINLARRLGQVQSAFRQESWERGKAEALQGFQLRGKTLGIIGFGAIGQKVAQICRDGFGMKTVAARREGQKYNSSEIDRLELDELLRISDFIVLSCPLTPENERLIDREALSKMKSSAYLINVARGRIVDTEALVDALKNKRIAGAALDVYDETPLSRTSAFFELEGLLLTPHVAAVTEDSMKTMAWKSAVQVVDILQGHYPEHWVNTEAQQAIHSRWAGM